jgi:hypothetical protein
VGAVIARFEMRDIKKGTEMKMDFNMTATPVFDNRMPKEIRGIAPVMGIAAAYEVIKDDILPTFEKFL